MQSTLNDQTAKILADAICRKISDTTPSREVIVQVVQDELDSLFSSDGFRSYLSNIVQDIIHSTPDWQNTTITVEKPPKLVFKPTTLRFTNPKICHLKSATCSTS